MKIRWSPEAFSDLAGTGEHIRKDDPEAALRVVITIYGSALALKNFPNRGKKGRVEGTRELPLTPLPLIIVYRVLSEAVEIANIIHGAQLWPKSQ